MLWSSEVAWPLTRFRSQRSWPVYGVSGSWGQERASSEGAERRDRTTEGQTEKAGQSGCRNKPPKKETCTAIQWEMSGSLHHFGPISQTECDLRLQPGLRLWLLKYNLLLTASNCNKWCYALEYSSSTVPLLQKSIMCTFKRHFSSCLLANT